ncbi:putative DNA-binding protein [Desnuesiella massiliensis]|uniref:putative DNA-binding protein n=1 Tax=Desnuesiella massiliensis TaxID=1650662 RepID=UPI0006E23B48|nr:putative DNA-binding protein [Desnuesiella massiliensis]
MEERIEISILLDYYGELLTDKQIEIMNMYYNEDLSLAEIAEINNTSRQAIHDTIKRCGKTLASYESKLNLYKKDCEFNLMRHSLLERLTKIDRSSLDSKNRDIINDIESILNKDI